MIQALLSKICIEIWGAELCESGLGCRTYCDNLVNINIEKEMKMKKKININITIIIIIYMNMPFYLFT